MTTLQAKIDSLSPKLAKPPSLIDHWLVFASIGLLAIGLLMVTSTSIVISESQYGMPFHYVFRQLVYLGIGFLLGFTILKIPIDTWKRTSGYLFVFSLILLLLVLIPGIGKEVNGSRRWLGFANLSFQVSEFAKLAIVLYLSGYFVRRQEEVRTKVIGFIKPMMLLALISVLLIVEPDFGATVVIMMTALTMLFLAGVPLRHFVMLVLFVGIGLTGLAFSSPYRIERLTSFLNPWATQFDSGYQLTQSLIAFGRGGWFGVGLGDSIQKLFYLPEAHTDFVFAVIAEELGLIGELTIIALFTLLVSRILLIGRRCHKVKNLYAAYVAYGLGLWIAFQAIINIGVNAGLLPTKGLTLPFISYGGSSLLMTCVIISILLRIDYEVRLKEYGL